MPEANRLTVAELLECLTYRAQFTGPMGEKLQAEERGRLALAWCERWADRLFRNLKFEQEKVRGYAQDVQRQMAAFNILRVGAIALLTGATEATKMAAAAHSAGGDVDADKLTEVMFDPITRSCAAMALAEAALEADTRPEIHAIAKKKLEERWQHSTLLNPHSPQIEAMLRDVSGNLH